MAIAVGMEWAGLLQLTIHFTGKVGFNPKLDIRHFEDWVNRRNGSGWTLLSNGLQL